MGSFTGYILLNRPGAIEISSGSFLESVKNSLSDASGLMGATKRTSAKPPFFSYLKGDVLINTPAESYLAETNIRLKINDEIFVSTNSTAVLKVGENQYLHLSEGTQAFLKSNPKLTPKGYRGFTTIKLVTGQILVDFFKSKSPVGVRIDFPEGHALSPDGTFRVEKTNEESTRVGVDRGMVMVTNEHNKGEVALQPGEGVVVNKASLVVDTYAWVDQYPWEKKIKETLLLGQGRKPTFKATLLSQRQSATQRKQVQQRPKRARNPRGGKVSFQNSKTQDASGSNKVNSFVKKLGNTATNALKNIPSVGGKIQESTETIQNFEKLQQDRVKALENMEE